MIEWARRDQNPVVSAWARRSSRRRGMTRRRLTRWPMTASSAGRNVAEAAIETSGTIRPPTPIERMKGRGMRTRSARPIATVMPEKIVARPAVAMVRSRAACGSSSARQLLPVAEHHQHRVVDGDREPDERDDVRHVDGHVHDVGEDPDEPQRGRDAHRREQERHRDPAQRPEHEREDDQRDGNGDRLPALEVLVVDLLGVVVDGREAREVGPGPGHRRRSPFAAWASRRRRPRSPAEW